MPKPHKLIMSTIHHFPDWPWLVSRKTRTDSVKKNRMPDPTLLRRSKQGGHPKSVGQSIKEFLSNRPWLLSRKTRAGGVKKSMLFESRKGRVYRF